MCTTSKLSDIIYRIGYFRSTAQESSLLFRIHDPLILIGQFNVPSQCGTIRPTKYPRRSKTPSKYIRELSPATLD